MSCSSTLQPNEFQSLNPMGGVLASPLSSAWAGAAVATTLSPAATTVAATTAPIRLVMRSLMDPCPSRYRRAGWAILRECVGILGYPSTIDQPQTCSIEMWRLYQENVGFWSTSQPMSDSADIAARHARVVVLRVS